MWDSEHAIEQADKARSFHEGPSDFAGEIETGWDRSFALRIEVVKPLDRGELG